MFHQGRNMSVRNIVKSYIFVDPTESISHYVQYTLIMQFITGYIRSCVLQKYYEESQK